ncbi:hypothetical protein [Pseudarthrobacter sp. ATCC 49987]|uniref:hypothetical protein n=1 Tax=Pseudarthrobacter sp. ATCC 49987 TaxID=2698204 RepID=UPI0013705038|nr:hypothetical protein [Pseudarthrobacter sp. ATCC 49987]
MDKYAMITAAETKPIKLLVCSQPLGIPAWSRRYAPQWYAFLESLLDQDIEGCMVRVRLHPAEVYDSAIPARLRTAHIAHPLEADIEWASHVASPFSTVLVEALAADRTFFALSADDAFDKQAQRTPFFADRRISVARWNKADIMMKIPGLAGPSALARDYLCNIGSSARVTANALESLASEYTSGE